MRVAFRTLVVCALFAAPPALAQSPLQTVYARIEAQGFEIYDSGRTWLGRLVIYARNDKFDREVVVSRGSGEILHDVWTPLAISKETNGPGKPQPPGNPGPGPGPEGHGGPGGGGE